MVPLTSNTQLGGTRHARLLGRRRLWLLVDLSVGLRRPVAHRDLPLPLARSPLVERWPWHHARRCRGAPRAVCARRDRHRRVPASPSGARWAVSSVLIAPTVSHGARHATPPGATPGGVFVFGGSAGARSGDSGLARPCTFPGVVAAENVRHVLEARTAQ